MCSHVFTRRISYSSMTSTYYDIFGRASERSDLYLSCLSPTIVPGDLKKDTHPCIHVYMHSGFLALGPHCTRSEVCNVAFSFCIKKCLVFFLWFLWRDNLPPNKKSEPNPLRVRTLYEVVCIMYISISVSCSTWYIRTLSDIVSLTNLSFWASQARILE